ncbi:MAG: 2-oxoglutarate dehydrogenase E1 component, partial [Planctomycetes bacterium]|nr:2-oxoglutarate dehydrogenase E1 component [Planctomycetota bacterium]
MRDPERTPNPASLAFAEELFAEWRRDPASVSPDWRAYFESLPGARADGLRLGPSFRAYSIFNPPEHAPAGGSGNAARVSTLAPGEIAAQQDKVDSLVRAYRVRGHLIARIDPLERPRPALEELDPASYGFGSADLDRRFSTIGIFGAPTMTLRQILEKLHSTYCRSIGVQYMHIDDLARKNWLQERMEASENRVQLSRAEQTRILTRLTDATLFEEFIQKKFLGAKSFSLEGSESLIPLLDLAIERAAEHGVAEIVIGMAHRGRLNVLANVMGKGARQIFREFADVDHALYRMRGDVKYHLGHASEYVASTGAKVQLSMCFNPSHLEFVDPVAVGRVRARQDRALRAGPVERGLAGLAILIHGDAAFAGQGVVQETLNMSQLPGYATGGTVHVIVNNQVGFTTDPQDGRSTTYCTDVARMLHCPIFHVNGEDPEAVAQVIRLAMDFRREWQSDVVIDMYGYRRRGHNEGDEPSFTQPRMYETIRARKAVREGYLDHLLVLGGLTRGDADRIEAECRARLEAELDVSKSKEYVYQSAGLGPVWSTYAGGRDADVPEMPTGFPQARLSALLAGTTRVPEGFTVHPKLVSILERRMEMARGTRALDWAAGEAAAFATLAVQGARVRLSGQDCERGTFSHRHTVLHDVVTGRRYMPLAHLEPGQAPIEIWNSPLSETGVMGFEYGYTLDQPEAL